MPPTIPSNQQYFGYCVDDRICFDQPYSILNLGSTYEISRFVNDPNFFPYGVRVFGDVGEIDNTFAITRFIYFVAVLN